MTADDARLEDAARRLLADSRFVARAVAAELGADAGEPQRLAHLTALAAAPWDAARQEGELQRRLAGAPPGPTALAVALRRLRRAVLLGTAVRDVAGLAPLSEVTGAMTALAQLAVQRGLAALAHEMAETFGVPMSAAGVPQDLLVVAMGKAGGGELNVSSDLDLVFVYDEAGQTQARAPFAGATRTLSNQEFFERLGRRLIALLSEPTADGFVFRVDMRLRPDGDAGPLAISNAMLEEYLIRQGREWERFAWLKGRVIAAPVFADEAQFAAQVRALQDIVRPFVFRKYLDYGAIAAQRELHARIRAETGKKSARRAGGHANHEDNIKLGRGGIREIEFVAQTFQIIRGGREPRLRERATLPTLATLAQLGLLPAATCEQLAAAYEFLRRLEHALQYVDDAQTHLLPADEAERARIARLLRLPDAQALLRQWEQTREFVAATFDAVFLAAPATGEAVQTQLEGEALVQRLAQLGYAEPATSAARVESLLASRRVAESERARSGIGALLAGVYEAVAQAARAAVPALSPDELLARLLRLLEVIARRSTYLALLAQYPRATAAVLRLLAASRWATDYLIRHPILLDELLDERLTRLTN
ncbi:MAG: bifunctional [glutamate--ammonia ligase]-adenylyl-L-tyrosine phosphorylase/[glutamate--ammonia-ligase] adenylyltransferase, partial [Sutterellaceae bacterium]|nr:bifunctional [glutamate--ammonia ligase]-adenylyl-L-tyrosine phosphorylase/[glutamate--ammonia-ligase] adenylyltransferase [Burkholderiaceae bacterium]MDW8429955.1 bifunctional [glutamate--ammonia ligase]-adenylyl-L-tyrosine phosphorylase/[glutamate--ammonia-ligase] adenylyltransferase [Sutterellaceae bacterium]